MEEVKKELLFKVTSSNYIEESDKIISEHVYNGWTLNNKEMLLTCDICPDNVDSYWLLKLEFISKNVSPVKFIIIFSIAKFVCRLYVDLKYVNSGFPIKYLS